MKKCRGSYATEWPDTVKIPDSSWKAPESALGTRGFRLTRDDIDKYRFRWGRSFTVPEGDAVRGISLEDYPDFNNQRIGIRLVVQWRER